jgi:hypothetical protein
MQKAINTLQQMVGSASTSPSSIKAALKQTFWIKTVADSLEKDRLDYKAKSISASTINVIKQGPNTSNFEDQADGYIKVIGENQALEQLPQMLSSVSPSITKWPEMWHKRQ